MINERWNHKVPVIINGERKFLTAKEWYEFLEIPKVTFQDNVKLLRKMLGYST